MSNIDMTPALLKAATVQRGEKLTIDQQKERLSNIRLIVRSQRNKPKEPEFDLSQIPF